MVAGPGHCRLSHHRIGFHPCGLRARFDDGRRPLRLAEFLRVETPVFIPCDRRALDSLAVTSPRKTTDIYLADLANARRWRLATLDEGIAHPATDLIPQLPVQP